MTEYDLDYASEWVGEARAKMGELLPDEPTVMMDVYVYGGYANADIMSGGDEAILLDYFWWARELGEDVMTDALRSQDEDFGSQALNPF